MARESRRLRMPPPVEPLVRLHTDRELRQTQQNVEDATQDARALPQRKGRKVTVNMPLTGTVSVVHGLGRKPIGFNQQNVTGGYANYKEISRNKRFIAFESTSECTVDLWIF